MSHDNSQKLRRDSLDELERKARAATPDRWMPTIHTWVDPETGDALIHAQAGPVFHRNRELSRAIACSEHAAAMNPATTLRLIASLKRLVRALEYISCEGMDDGDFYSEEYLADGTIAMANRAREALAEFKADWEGGK